MKVFLVKPEEMNIREFEELYTSIKNSVMAKAKTLWPKLVINFDSDGNINRPELMTKSRGDDERYLRELTYRLDETSVTYYLRNPYEQLKEWEEPYDVNKEIDNIISLIDDEI